MNSIEIIWKDGSRWNIHRSILKTTQMLPRGWFSDREWDMLNTLIIMEKKGIAIKSQIHTDTHRHTDFKQNE